MLRKMISIPGGIAHYVVGSVYLMTHLVTCERRCASLSEHVSPA
jgi:hypothetical protein